jgi:TolB-like protein
MSRRRTLPCTTNSRAAQHAAAARHAPARSLPRRDGGAFGAPKAERAAMPWPCLLSSIAVGVAPLRNLTGDTDQENLLDAFTSDLAADLTRYGRGFSLRRLAKAPANFAEGPESDVKYFVTGSAQRGSPGMLRINVRITDASTSEYLWARRFEFDADEAVPMQAKIIRRISRELHILLLQQEVGRVVGELGAGHELNECLSSAATALEGELRPDLTAEAQRWYLAALADDPRNVEALVGLARTCQELVSNPWWGDPLAASVASDLGREVVAIALNLAPGAADAHCVQGMLHSAAGKLDEAALAFERALAMDQGLAIAHGFAAYNAAFLGSAGKTLPAIERAMRLDRADRRHSIWFFFGGFAELLIGRTDASIALLRKSLERNSTYGSARMFLIAALWLSGRYREAAEAAASFRQQYPDGPAGACEQLWLSRSRSATYRAQILPVFDTIRSLGVGT